MANRKLAFCFLVYDSIEMESTWNSFFKNICESKYSIYIHRKNKCSNKISSFQKNIIEDPIDTQYFHYSLVQAQNKLLEHATKDPSNTHFIFLCGTSVPVKSFDHIFENISEFSTFNVRKHERDLIKQKPQYISVIKKASQWSILNRKHAIEILNNLGDVNNIIENNEFAFEGAFDEKIYFSFLSTFYPNELLINKSINDYSMFEYWTSEDLDIFENNLISANETWWLERLKLLFFINKDEIDFIMKSKAFFTRKICLHSFIFDKNHEFQFEGRADPKELKKLLQGHIFKSKGVLLSNYLKNKIL